MKKSLRLTKTRAAFVIPALWTIAIVFAIPYAIFVIGVSHIFFMLVFTDQGAQLQVSVKYMVVKLNMYIYMFTQIYIFIYIYIYIYYIYIPIRSLITTQSWLVKLMLQSTRLSTLERSGRVSAIYIYIYIHM